LSSVHAGGVYDRSPGRTGRQSGRGTERGGGRVERRGAFFPRWPSSARFVTRLSGGKRPSSLVTSERTPGPVTSNGSVRVPARWEQKKGETRAPARWRHFVLSRLIESPFLGFVLREGCGLRGRWPGIAGFTCVATSVTRASPSSPVLVLEVVRRRPSVDIGGHRRSAPRPIFSRAHTRAFGSRTNLRRVLFVRQPFFFHGWAIRGGFEHLVSGAQPS